jgi:dTMP kinase
VYSSLAYQGGARGLGIEQIRLLNDFAVGGVLPDVVVLLELPPEVAASRLSGIPDKLEAAGTRFHDTVLATYRQLAAREPDRFLIVAADGGYAQVEAAIWAAIEPFIEADSQ